MKRRTSIFTVLLSVAIVALFLLGRSVLRIREIRTNLPRIQAGMPAAQVKALLGNPTKIAKPCWTDVSHCDYDYVYRMPLRLVSYWVISFNDQGRVIDKEDWHSP